MKTHILFDLDGTLIDSKLGITNGAMFSLQSMGIEVPDPRQLERLIGPPIRDSYRDIFGLDAQQTEAAVAKYREYYATQGLYECSLYPGIPHMLESLKSSGKTLAVATSKAIGYAQQILAHLDIAHYFTFVAGSELDGRRSTKQEVIQYTLNHLDNPPKSTVLMVGDTKYDMEGARLIGIDPIGVLYGYGDHQELTAAQAKHITPTVDALTQLLLREDTPW